MIQYISTRGPGQPQSFESVLLSGMAPDGGLYVPENWPKLDPGPFALLAGRPYADLARTVLQQFAGDLLPPDEIRALVEPRLRPQR